MAQPSKPADLFADPQFRALNDDERVNAMIRAFPQAAQFERNALAAQIRRSVGAPSPASPPDAAPAGQPAPAQVAAPAGQHPAETGRRGQDQGWFGKLTSNLGTQVTSWLNGGNAASLSDVAQAQAGLTQAESDLRATLAKVKDPAKRAELATKFGINMDPSGLERGSTLRNVIQGAATAGAGVVDAMASPLGIATLAAGGPAASTAARVAPRATNLVAKGLEYGVGGTAAAHAVGDITKAVRDPSTENVMKAAGSTGEAAVFAGPTVMKIGGKAVGLADDAISAVSRASDPRLRATTQAGKMALAGERKAVELQSEINNLNARIQPVRDELALIEEQMKLTGRTLPPPPTAQEAATSARQASRKRAQDPAWSAARETNNQDPLITRHQNLQKQIAEFEAKHGIAVKQAELDGMLGEASLERGIPRTPDREEREIIGSLQQKVFDMQQRRASLTEQEAAELRDMEAKLANWTGRPQQVMPPVETGIQAPSIAEKAENLPTGTLTTVRNKHAGSVDALAKRQQFLDSEFGNAQQIAQGLENEIFRLQHKAMPLTEAEQKRLAKIVPELEHLRGPDGKSGRIEELRMAAARHRQDFDQAQRVLQNYDNVLLTRRPTVPPETAPDALRVEQRLAEQEAAATAASLPPGELERLSQPITNRATEPPPDSLRPGVLRPPLRSPDSPLAQDPSLLAPVAAVPPPETGSSIPYRLPVRAQQLAAVEAEGSGIGSMRPGSVSRETVPAVMQPPPLPIVSLPKPTAPPPELPTALPIADLPTVSVSGSVQPVAMPPKVETAIEAATSPVVQNLRAMGKARAAARSKKPAPPPAETVVPVAETPAVSAAAAGAEPVNFDIPLGGAPPVAAGQTPAVNFDVPLGGGTPPVAPTVTPAATPLRPPVKSKKQQAAEKLATIEHIEKTAVMPRPTPPPETPASTPAPVSDKKALNLKAEIERVASLGDRIKAANLIQNPAEREAALASIRKDMGVTRGKSQKGSVDPDVLKSLAAVGVIGAGSIGAGLYMDRQTNSIKTEMSALEARDRKWQDDKQVSLAGLSEELRNRVGSMANDPLMPQKVDYRKIDQRAMQGSGPIGNLEFVVTPYFMQQIGALRGKDTERGKMVTAAVTIPVGAVEKRLSGGGDTGQKILAAWKKDGGNMPLVLYVDQLLSGETIRHERAHVAQMLIANKLKQVMPTPEFKALGIDRLWDSHGSVQEESPAIAMESKGDKGKRLPDPEEEINPYEMQVTGPIADEMAKDSVKFDMAHRYLDAVRRFAPEYYPIAEVMASQNLIRQRVKTGWPGIQVPAVNLPEVPDHGAPPMPSVRQVGAAGLPKPAPPPM